MSRITVLKVVLALTGVALVFWGARANIPPVRWVGLSLVAAAWLLRIVERGKRRAD